MRKWANWRAWALTAVLLVPAGAGAVPFTSIQAFGDSLSDNGNLYNALFQLQPPSPPYFEGRFSNGPVAVERMADTLGVPLDDFAWGGATSGWGNAADGGSPASFGLLRLPGVATQVLAYGARVGPGGADPDALYLLWGGANDLLFDLSGPVPAALRITFLTSALAQLGAEHILVPNLPDLGKTPSERAEGPGASFASTVNSVIFNRTLASQLTRLDAMLPDVTIYQFDTFSLFNEVLANPGAFGFANVTEACFDGVSVCANPDQYLFWDGVHPTARAHAILAGRFVAAVPEPSTYALMAAGLVLVAFAARRRPIR